MYIYTLAFIFLYHIFLFITFWWFNYKNFQHILSPISDNHYFILRFFLHTYIGRLQLPCMYFYLNWIHFKCLSLYHFLYVLFVSLELLRCHFSTNFTNLEDSFWSPQMVGPWGRMFFYNIFPLDYNLTNFI